MNLKKSLVSGIAALGMLTAIAQPASAEQPPFFQHQSQHLKATQIGQYNSLAGSGGTEIVTYDKQSKRAYVTNGAQDAIDILSLGHLTTGTYEQISSQKRVYLKDFGIKDVSDITSVAVHPTDNVVALSVVSNPKTDPGYVVFLTKDGEYIGKVQVGALPDMVVFTPDGKKVLTADEGEPNDDYTIDPEGSVSIIDITKGYDNLTATTLTFHHVPMDEHVRLSSEGTIAQQIEPEYIVVSADSKTAYVALQENNAIATVDLTSNKIVYVKGLGVKDHSLPGNELDGKRDGKTTIEKLPLLGFYMPDAIDLYTVNGKNYIVTPNEGDARDYAGYSEEAEIGDIVDKIELKAEHYGGYTQEELDQLVAEGLLSDMKKTKITLENGERNGKYEALYSYGGRSFSIFDADTMELVYDSGSDFERIIAEAKPNYFNTDNKDISYDKRSSAKGPEPETAVIGTIDGKQYAFIALERFSGVMVYDVSNPKKPVFTTLISSRDFSQNVGGDVSPEGLTFIEAKDSPTGNPLLLTAHEVSGTVAVYEFGGEDISKPLVFKDVQSSNWAYSYIQHLHGLGVVSGIDQTTFAPQKDVTRMEFAVMLARSLELQESTKPSTFMDVPKWGATEVQALVEAGIVQGKNAKSFDPSSKITREQMAAMVVRAYEYKTKTPVKSDATKTFDDAHHISSFAKESVQKIQALGLMEGNGQKQFAPQEASTRAQSAKVLSLLLKELNK